MAAVEAGPGTDHSDEVGCVHSPPAGLGGLGQLETIASPAARLPAPLVRGRTVVNVDSMGFVVRGWIQCSAATS